MGLDGLTFGGVTTYLSEFFGSGIVAGAIAAAIALGLGGYGLSILINSFRK